jgi:hypothetical protein
VCGVRVMKPITPSSGRPGSMGDDLEMARRALTVGPEHLFRERLDSSLPRVAAGCYTIWDEHGRFVYAGMAGERLKREHIADARDNRRAKVTGLRDRLSAHRQGRRSGDQFAAYIFDRFVLGQLSIPDLASAVAGQRRLDLDVRNYIHAHLSYRWVETSDGPALGSRRIHSSPRG